MLSDYLNNFKRMHIEPKEINFGFILYKFYNCRLSVSKAKKIAFNAFKKIKSDLPNYHGKDFLTNHSDLILALEILEKNEFFEADLAEVLKLYDKDLLEYLSRKKVYDPRDLPYYLQLLLNRLRHNVTIPNPIFHLAITQVAQKIIAYLDQEHVLELNAANYIYVLIEIYKLDICSAYLLPVLKKIALAMELQVKNSNRPFAWININNYLLYPLLCQTLSKKMKFNINPLLKSFLLSDREYSTECIDIHYLYFINTSLRWSEYTSDLEIKSLIEAELNTITQISKSQPCNINHYLLALTINSFLNNEENSWDEIILTPRY